MKAILRTLVCAWALGVPLGLGAEPSCLVNFGQGLSATVQFSKGPGVSDDGKFESSAHVVVSSNFAEGKRVRMVEFDAIMNMGRYTHRLSDNRAPKVTRVDASAWDLSNIFFTMEKKWEGKLTLGFEDGTEQTEWFPIEVKRH